MPNEWFYFGCHREAGHYVFLQGMRPCWRHGWPRELSRFDGMLPPQMDTAGYVATVSRLQGWGLSALAFWDYSVDKRSGCNSIVFAPSLTITPEDLLAQAQVRFPEVFNRLPQPVTFASGVTVVSPAQPDHEAAQRGFEHEVACDKAAAAPAPTIDSLAMQAGFERNEFGQLFVRDSDGVCSDELRKFAALVLASGVQASVTNQSKEN